MEKRSPIFTGKGDYGYTSADSIGKTRVPKDSNLIRLFGKIDSLQAIVDAAIFENSGKDREMLEEVQNRLWRLYPAKPDAGKFMSQISKIDLNNLQNFIFEVTENVPDYFIRFHTRQGITLNECRVRCREAETYSAPLLRERKIDPIIGAYLNRLSSFFYALSLKAEQRNQV